MYLRLSVSVWVSASWACSPSTEKVTTAPDWKKVPVAIELRLAQGAPGPDLVPAAVYGQAGTVYLHQEAPLSNSHIARVEPVKTRLGEGLVLQVWFTKAGAQQLAEVTGGHIGDSLAVLINGVVVSVPVIQDTLGRDPRLPNDIGVPLKAEEVQQLATAVSKTWPPASAPSRPSGKGRNEKRRGT
jgi:preprotein translocase subunit SecD